jgi:ribosomal protein S18 acetylase RimI-like enzyme
MLRGGAYFGILDADRLLAVAGTHLLAPQAGMAALGNVVTRPEARGQGHGTIVSQAVTESLLARGFELIVLNVRRENHAAIRIYHKLGYYRTGDFIEGFAERRD